MSLPPGTPDLRIPELENDIVNSINQYLNIPSIVLALLVVLIVLALHLYDRKLVDRVSLRLNALISATDVISGGALVVYAYASISQDGIGCGISAFLLVWMTNQYLFLTACIAYNLQYLFLEGKPFRPWHEKWYYIVSIGLSFLTGLLPLVLGRFGYDDAQDACWYTPSWTAQSQRWEYGTFLVPIMLTMTYCTIVFVLVVHKIRRENRQLDKFMDSGPGSKNRPTAAEIRRRQTRKNINRVVMRIILYITIPVATQLGFIVSEIWTYTHWEVSWPLNLWSVLTSALPGILNFIAFMMDPGVHAAFRSVKGDLISKYSEDATSPSRPATRKSVFARWFVRTFLGTVARQPDGSTFYRMSEPHPSANADMAAEYSQNLELCRISLGEEDKIKVDVAWPPRAYSTEPHELRPVRNCVVKEPDVAGEGGRDQRKSYYARL